MTDRERMIEDQLRRRGIADPRVLAAFDRLPREAFVDAAQREAAYDDAPLPIGYGQTISQPYVVALTAEALRLLGHERVLEIGTGSGYAAAVLGALAREVHTVERIAALATAAAVRLRELGCTNVHVHCGDGSLGWPAAAPYDAIAVAASAPQPPPSLLHQLVIGGQIIIPIGNDGDQQLVRITRRAAETFDEDNLGDVRFVRLVGAEGWA